MSHAVTPGDTPASLNTDFRERVIRFADALDVPKRDVLFQSASKDPLNKGTDADHAKARWFADLWEDAVDNRGAKAIHIRGLHYVIVQLEHDVEPPTSSCGWERYANTRTCYGYLTEAGVCARVLGYVPMGGIADEKNTQQVVTEYDGHDTDARVSPRTDAVTPTETPAVPTVDDFATVTYETVDDYIDETADRVAGRVVDRIDFDVDVQQPYHVELWSEKALPGAVKRTARDAGVDAIVEGEGHLSYRVAHDFVERVEAARKPAVVFYLADFDPAGEAMPGAMASKVSWLDLAGSLTHRVTLSRLAVTREQVETYDLPREPVTTDTDAAAYETMADDFQDRHDGGAVELSALEADLNVYCEIIRSGIESVTDDTLVDRNADEKRDVRETVRRRVVDALRDADLNELDDDLRGWVDEFNDELDDAADTLDRLQSLNDDGAPERWESRVADALDDVTVPAVNTPEGDADTPDDVMYDSAADYLENLQTLHPDATAYQQQLSHFDGGAGGGL